LFLIPSFVFANLLVDTDLDGVPDVDEINVYRTDPGNADTDGDGYSDWRELNAGFSPHNSQKIKLKDNDQDGDGLIDKDELRFKTDILNKDTDGDGHSDGDEIKAGYDPLDKEKIFLPKRIEVNIAKQELSYFLGDVRMGTYPVSSGVRNSTPKGNFTITNKSPKAWSPYGLWMPYWMGLNSGRVGIHELPIWPNGYREGENHLGTSVSHGCIRLGIGAAKFIYDWTPVGTGVVVY